MKIVTPKQIEKTIGLIADSGIRMAQYQELLESGKFVALLQEFMPNYPTPTITPIKVPLDYGRTLVEMRDAGGYDGYVATELNDENFPVEAGENGEREFVLVCFHRDISDYEDPAKSELLQELDKLGLKPEGPSELCAVGEHYPNLQREFSIVARRQVWRFPKGLLVCPLLREDVHERRLDLYEVPYRWNSQFRFLSSRK